MYIRKQIFQDLGEESAFLWGARQTGKSTLLHSLYPGVKHYFDLQLNNEFERFQRNPSLLREILALSPAGELVIVDEIQRIPALLYEIQWLIVNQHYRFILSGSSPRRIIRSGGNLLGGRAIRYELFRLYIRRSPHLIYFVRLITACCHGITWPAVRENYFRLILAAT